MNLSDVLELLEGKTISQDVDLQQTVQTGCGADLMSDVLAFAKEGTLLLTGLTNPQVVRTAEMAGVKVIVFVRGKIPPEETVALAAEKGIPLLATRYTMFDACGLLYKAGLAGCGLAELTVQRWHGGFEAKE